MKNINNKVECVGILVIYYNDFINRSILEFESLINNISRKNMIFIISNFSEYQKTTSKSKFLNWNNQNQEFGAWQYGLEQALDKLNYNSKPCFIFANDTFCYHKTYGGFEKYMYSKFFKKIVDLDQKIIVGPTSSSKLGQLSFEGSVFTRWVSTSLFGISYKLMETFKFNICIDQKYLNKYFDGQTEKDFFSKKLDNSMKNHLIAWLFGRSNLPMWRNGTSLNNENYLIMKNKASSILREKNITANAILSNAVILDVFKNLKIRKIFFYLLRLFKYK